MSTYVIDRTDVFDLRFVILCYSYCELLCGLFVLFPSPRVLGRLYFCSSVYSNTFMLVY